MEHVRKMQATLQPHIARLEAYLNTTEKPDPFVKLMAVLENKTGFKRIHILGGASGVEVEVEVEEGEERKGMEI
jgi:hypothetical protein